MCWNSDVVNWFQKGQRNINPVISATFNQIPLGEKCQKKVMNRFQKVNTVNEVFISEFIE